MVATINDQAEQDLLDKKNVVAVGTAEKRKDGQKTGKESVTVFVRTKKIDQELDDEDIIPDEIDGMETDVVEIGEVEAEPVRRTEPADVEAGDLDTQERKRPFPVGVSVGHKDITSGTAGPIMFTVEEKEVGGETIKQPVPVSVSNNHVYANMGDARENDSILQPGPYDGGEDIDSEYRIGGLGDYVEIVDYEKNIVDAAYAYLDDIRTANSYIPKIGIPSDVTTVERGDVVEKTGRTTGYRKGEVLSTDATIRVRYDNGVREFKDQVLTESMSKPGDSGSAGVYDGKLFGLLFAGSSEVTVFNKIQNVMDELDLYISPREAMADE